MLDTTFIPRADDGWPRFWFGNLCRDLAWCIRCGTESMDMVYDYASNRKVMRCKACRRAS